jgi:hypothetical protein
VCGVLAASNTAFFDNVIRANLNPAGADILWANLEVLLRYQGVPVALVLLGAAAGVRVRRWAEDPLVGFWFVSLLLLPITLAKVGSNWNYWIMFAAATAPLATWSVWGLLAPSSGCAIARSAWRRGVAAVLVLGLLASPAWLPRPVLDLRSVVTRVLQPDRQQSEAFAGVLRQVRTERREVLAEPLDIVVLADRSIVLEPYIFSILSTQGQWDPRVLVRQVCDGQIGLLVLDHPLDGPDWETQGYEHWPPAVLAALRSTMRLDQTLARLFLYRPAINAATGASVANPSDQCRNAAANV